MTEQQIDDLTHNAVRAALAVIDEATGDATRRSAGPCGDELAGKLDKDIKAALVSYYKRREEFCPRSVSHDRPSVH